MSDDLAPELDVQTILVPLGKLPRGVTWPVIQRGMPNRPYIEPDWLVWLQRARVYTVEAACLSMGWCPTAWAEWHFGLSRTAEIRETARPYLDMLAQRADIFGIHHDADITVGQGDEKMIGLSSARRIASDGNWDVPEEFRLPLASSSFVGLAYPPKIDERVARDIKLREVGKVGKRKSQIKAIETAIVSLGFVALKIKTGDKGKVRAECQRADTEKLFGGGKWPFDEAWQDAVNQERVRMDEHDRFARR